MGLIGALLVILLFAYLIYRGFRVARYAPDKFGSLLATGITAKLAIQTLMNLFVVTGIMPVTGAALPFFSYGGTALMLQLGEMGILLNISRYMRIDGRNQDEVMQIRAVCSIQTALFAAHGTVRQYHMIR